MNKLSPNEAEYFFKLHRSLLHFTNQKYGTYPKFKSVDDFQDLSSDDIDKGITPIREKVYESSNIKEFCDKNPFNFTEKDLSVVNKWKDKLKIEGYLVKHLSNYTVFMAQPTPNSENKLYGIKGISNSISDMFPSNYLPYRANLILLPFLDHIIYDGFINGYNIHFGSGIKRRLNEEYNQAKALDGIYSKYTTGDNLSNPPKTASVKDTVTYSIKKSFDRGEFPRRALEYAEQHNERSVFEKEYTSKYIKHDKKNLKNNDDLPKMHYGAYRETIIAVQPSKKELQAFCKKHYSKLIDYITMFSI